MNTKTLILSLLISLFLFACSEEGKIELNAEDFFHVEVAGAQLPVKVRGNTSAQKIILYIQGGPGGTGLDVSVLDPGNWENNIEKKVAMAYYDQRGIGNAQGNFEEGSITLDQYVADIHAIIRVLGYRYPDAKIYLMGHSFGAMLVYRYITTFGTEQLAEKYIAAAGIGTRFRDEEHWEVRRAYVENIASQKVNNQEEHAYWEEVLAWLAEHPVLETIETRAKLFEFMQKTQIEEEISISVSDVYNILLASDNNFFPYYLKLVERQQFINKLTDEERQWNIKSDIPKIDQPLLLIGGEYDISAPPQELEWIYQTISSLEKRLLILPNSGHDHYISQPELFSEAVLGFINE